MAPGGGQLAAVLAAVTQGEVGLASPTDQALAGELAAVDAAEVISMRARPNSRAWIG
jgi:hypothetical protein